jgi:RimJ/RimL family protein N-acetyltransferase
VPGGGRVGVCRRRRRRERVTGADVNASLPLVTERLELRPFAPADLDDLLVVFGDPDVMRFVGSGRRPLDRERLAESQGRVVEHWREHGFGPLAVVERATGRLVGEAGLQVLEGGPEVEVTYTLARAVWGRGYATEAARAVLAWGFAGLGLGRIVAVSYPQNAASLRVIAKLGMRPAGEQRCYGALLAKFALTADEWHAAAAGVAP